MKTPRGSTLVIVAQFFMLVLSLGFLGWTWYQNWFLEQDAKLQASEIGFNRARSDFMHKRHYLYEMKLFKVSAEGAVPTDDTSEPTGRRDGPYEIQALLTDDDYPAFHKRIRQTLINAYNQHMHQMCENPEWFDTNGFRVPRPNPDSGAGTITK
jgi:hypothetical protein